MLHMPKTKTREHYTISVYVYYFCICEYGLLKRVALCPEPFMEKNNMEVICSIEFNNWNNTTLIASLHQFSV